MVFKRHDHVRRVSKKFGCPCVNRLGEARIDDRDVEFFRRELLRRTAERRAAKRRSERAIKQGKSRFIVLSVTLLATAVIVSVVMFRALYLILE